nr:LOW QUALITY PROTEIN: AP-5 complex subunit beta-1 [Pogona vitticeps]
MGSRGGESWPDTIAAFRSGPTAFLLSHGANDTFVAELLRDLRSERLTEQLKVSLLMLLLDYPTLLCRDVKAGQEAAASLLSLFTQLGPGSKHASLRRHLLFATGTVLVATDAFGPSCQASGDYLALLRQLASDLNDGRGGAAEWPVRAAACECLRELATIHRLVLLPSPGDLRELKLVVSALLEGSYLLSPAAQSHLLWHLAQVVSMVRTQSPAIFKAQLVRLFGTADAALQHALLQLKALFTDSLFTSEDEAFLLRRLVALAQHPALPTPVTLFHLDCLLHFPENRPLGSGTEEGLPVLLTPGATSGLFPALFQDPATALARLNVMCLVCVESEGPMAEQGAGYLLEHVLALGGPVARGGGPEAVRLFFQAAFLFARSFGAREPPMAQLTQCVLDLYRQNGALAPNVINLLDESWGAAEESRWSRSLARGLQALIVGSPLTPGRLGGHLKVLARLAKEKDLPRLEASAVYATPDGLTRCSRLEPVEVTFSDLFMPLPVPAWPSEKRQGLFGALWHRLDPGAEEKCAESLTVLLWHRLDPGTVEKCAESLTVLPVAPEDLGAMIRSHFARYVVAEQGGSYEIGMVLPPGCHILLRVRSVDDVARVGIRTDNWKLLPSLNNYLQGLAESR